MRVGVCIPCHAPHLEHLNECLRSIDAQTVKPSVIAISLSSYSNATPPPLTSTVPIRWTITADRLCAAANRNRAAASIAEEVDILSCIDADDWMCERRIELIVKHFVKHGLDVLLHNTIQVKRGSSTQDLCAELEAECYTAPFMVGRDSVCGRVWYVGNTGQRDLGTCGHVSVSTAFWKKQPCVEGYGMGEDSEYIWRLKMAGAKLGFTNDRLSVYVR